MGMAEGIECCPCDSKVSGSIPGAVNLKKLFIWMKIHGQSQTIIACPSGFYFYKKFGRVPEVSDSMGT